MFSATTRWFQMISLVMISAAWMQTTAARASKSELCPDNCMGQSCDYHVARTRDMTCARLEKFSCNCQGCKCRSRRVNPAKMTTTAATPKVNSAPKPKLPAGTCEDNCMGQSCDYHVARTRDMTCARLEKFSCNCQGCKCLSRRVNPAKMTTTAATPKVNSAPKPKLPAGTCEDNCMGQSCDYHVIHSRDLTCARLEKFSCNCQGCKCDPATMTTTAAAPKVSPADYGLRDWLREGVDLLKGSIFDNGDDDTPVVVHGRKLRSAHSDS